MAVVRRVHIVPVEDETNGVWRVANMLAAEDGGTVQLGCSGLDGAEEVWVHGMWLPREWRACWRALRLGKRLVRMTHGSLSPVYLRYHGWKKWLVGPIERCFLRKADRIVATCEAEKGWIEKYLGKKCPPIEVTDIKRFFDLNRVECEEHVESRPLHLLYLGRRHPLKGVEYLEEAVKGLEGVALRVVSNAFGEEKEKVWEWCDVLVLPTLSENFGLVIAEALERGKRVITTDGAPAWEDYVNAEAQRSGGAGRQLIYLRGYRNGTAVERVALLRKAIEECI